VKDLIVHVDSSAYCAARIELALRLAKDLEAHIGGVYAQQAAAAPLADESLQEVQAGAVTALESVEYNMRMARVDAKAAEQLFCDRVAAVSVTATWHMMAGSAADVVVAYARYADLAIVGQTPSGGEDVAAEVARRSGRPVLVAPRAQQFPLTAQRVLVAWDASREAARALNDALPLLRRAREVTLLSVGPTEKIPPGADIVKHLSRHGVEAALVEEDDSRLSAADTLLARAGQLGCDLIVMGAYGHSPLRERMLGGTTRDVLKHMTLPVLVAH
jgi:nucleotide-binding universal stress UspA family protein